MLDSRPKGPGLEPRRRHCVVVLEQDTFNPSLLLVQPRKTCPFITEILLMGRKESNQSINQFITQEKNLLLNDSDNRPILNLVETKICILNQIPFQL